jgi:hypothetical protein
MKRASVAKRIILLLLTIALGVASRVYRADIPDVAGSYAGDLLWAAALYWLLSLVMRGANPFQLALTTLMISVAVELSQLYHAPWIDAIRATTPGAAMLGRGFLWSDLVCYAAGASLAAMIDHLLLRHAPKVGPR